MWVLDELFDVIAWIEQHAAPRNDAGLYQGIVRMFDADDLGIGGPFADFRQQPLEAWPCRNEQDFAIMRPACFNPAMNPWRIGANIGDDDFVVDAVARGDVNARLLLPCSLRLDEAADFATIELVQTRNRHAIDGGISMQDMAGTIMNGIIQHQASEYLHRDVLDFLPCIDGFVAIHILIAADTIDIGEIDVGTREFFRHGAAMRDDLAAEIACRNRVGIDECRLRLALANDRQRRHEARQWPSAARHHHLPNVDRMAISSRHAVDNWHECKIAGIQLLHHSVATPALSEIWFPVVV